MFASFSFKWGLLAFIGVIASAFTGQLTKGLICSALRRHIWRNFWNFLSTK